jgi:hypothetical protein
VAITAWPPRPGGLGRVFGGGQQPVTVSALESADGPRTRKSRTMDLSTLRPGPYTLSVVVTDQRNRSDTASRQFRILEQSGSR